jgi:hypothetical protein
MRCISTPALSHLIIVGLVLSACSKGSAPEDRILGDPPTRLLDGPINRYGAGLRNRARRSWRIA